MEKCLGPVVHIEYKQIKYKEFNSNELRLGIIKGAKVVVNLGFSFEGGAPEQLVGLWGQTQDTHVQFGGGGP